MGRPVDAKAPKFTERLSLGILTRTFSRDLVDEVLNDTRRREKRSRLLPARVVVYYVMALGLFFGESYDEVIRRLVGGLRLLRSWGTDWSVPTASAITQARKRLGEAPLKELFDRAAVPFATPGTPGSWFGEWRVMAVDGVILDCPDTASNDAEFGRADTGRGAAAFPQPRVVGLVECGTHAVVAATIGGWHTGERTLVDDVLHAIEPGMLILADRGFHGFRLWTQIADRGAATVFRIPSLVVLPAITELPDGSYISVLFDPKYQSPIRQNARRFANGNVSAEHEYLLQHGTPCRVIEYQVGSSEETYRIITSLLDHLEAPATEIAALYQQRWEIENLFDEIEIHQMGHGRVLRSQSEEMVRQEIWGILLTHYAIRRFMHDAAEAVGVDDDRMSFITALRIIRHDLTSRTEFSPQS